MSSLTGSSLAEVGVDAVALKPAAVDVERATTLDVSTLTIDYEGREHVPSPETLRSLASERAVRVTVPVRADGFDPLGADDRLRALPDAVGTILVAGHRDYLTPTERRRELAPRFVAASERLDDPWVGTENVERLALAVGATQFDLLSGTVERDVRGLRRAGFEADVAVYAPTVLSDDEDVVLDAIGDYVARRRSVAARLPEGTPTDGRASGEARTRLLAACREYALVGSEEIVAARVDALRAAGVDTVVAYPARGLDRLLD